MSRVSRRAPLMGLLAPVRNGGVALALPSLGTLKASFVLVNAHRLIGTY